MKYLLLLTCCAALAMCSTVTPDQATQFATTAHVVVANGLADFKTVKAVTK